MQQYRAVLQQNPRLIAAMTDCGDALTALGRFAEAISQYKEAVQVTGSFSGKADRMAERGMHQEAINRYRVTLGLTTEVIFPESISVKVLYGAIREKDERRQHDRFVLRFPVDIRCESGDYLVAKSINVSKKGLLIKSDTTNLDIGSDVEVISRVNLGGKRIASKGKIVRIDRTKSNEKHRFGIELAGESGEWKKFISL